MTLHLHLAPDLGDLAVWTDQEGGAFDAHVFAAIELLEHPDAIGFADLAGLVGDQCH